MTNVTGERVKALREAMGEKPAAFAQRVGISYDYFHQIEIGARNGSVKVIADIAAQLGTTTDYLTGASDDPGIPGASEYPVASPDIARLVARLNGLPATERAAIGEIVNRILDYGRSTKTQRASDEMSDRFLRIWRLIGAEKRDQAMSILEELYEEQAAEDDAGRSPADQGKARRKGRGRK